MRAKNGWCVRYFFGAATATGAATAAAAVVDVIVL
jgi:hypothetical protein